jgi:hypothetical protein
MFEALIFELEQLVSSLIRLFESVWRVPFTRRTKQSLPPCFTLVYSSEGHPSQIHHANPVVKALDWLAVSLLLDLASTVILCSQSHGSDDVMLLSDGSRVSTQPQLLLRLEVYHQSVRLQAPWGSRPWISVFAIEPLSCSPHVTSSLTKE